MATEKKKQLPNELLADILRRLPVKSILVCKSVSKSWCDLINDPYFVQTHLLCSSTKAKSESTQFVAMYRFLVPGGPKLYILKDKLVSSVSSSSPWNQKIEFPEYRIRRCSPQPCRGLLSFTTIFPPEPNDKLAIVAINPATRRFRELPNLGPIEDPYFLQFGLSYIVFDSSLNTYKVLWISTNGSTNGERDVSIVVSVINLVKDVSWRKVAIPSDAKNCACWAFPSLHHQVPYQLNAMGLDTKALILVFDAEHENFLTFSFFQTRDYNPSNPNLRAVAACQGSIYIFSGCDATITNKVLDVWVMKDYKISETWVKENSFNLQFLYEGPSHSVESDDTLRKIGVQGVIDHDIVLKIQNRVYDGVYVIYDTINKALKRHEIQRYGIDEDEELDEELVEILEPFKVEARIDVLMGEFHETLVSPELGY